MAGGGVKPGLTLGETDDFAFNVVKDKVHVHDLNATVLHLLGFDQPHEADLPLPGPRLPPDGRARGGGGGAAGVSGGPGGGPLTVVECITESVHWLGR